MLLNNNTKECSSYDLYAADILKVGVSSCASELRKSTIPTVSAMQNFQSEWRFDSTVDARESKKMFSKKTMSPMTIKMINNEIQQSKFKVLKQ